MVNTAQHEFNIAQAALDDIEWDSFVASNPLGHHEQSSMYGHNRQEYGFGVDRVVVRHDKIVVGGVQILSQLTPLGTFVYIQRGPLANFDDPRILKEVLILVDDLASERGYSVIRVDTFPQQIAARNALSRAGYKSELTLSGERKALIMPLTGTDEDILNKVSKSVRNGYRHAIKSGVTLSFGYSQSVVEDFYTVLRMTATYNNFPIFPVKYFHYLFHYFGPMKKIIPVVAYHDSKPVAATIKMIVGDYMHGGWAGISRDQVAKKTRANNLLHLSAMLQARMMGCKYYDHGDTHSFKKQYACEVIVWPPPMWKFYGVTSRFRLQIIEHALKISLLKKGVRKIGRFFKIPTHEGMPW